MKTAAFVPRSAHERKPPHGAPCNRCGVCCMATLCPLGEFVFKRQAGPCPALKLDGGNEYGCGLVSESSKHVPILAAAQGADKLSKAAALLIGSGTGCDCRINGEPANEAFYLKLNEWDRNNQTKVLKAKKAWRMR